MLSIWIAYIGLYETKKSFALEKNKWLDICNVQSEIKW